VKTTPFDVRVVTLSCVFHLVADHLGVDRTALSPQMSLRSLGADDLDEIELVILLEQEFDIEIADGEIDNDKTLGDLVNVVLKHGAEP